MPPYFGTDAYRESVMFALPPDRSPDDSEPRPSVPGGNPRGRLNDNDSRILNAGGENAALLNLWLQREVIKFIAQEQGLPEHEVEALLDDSFERDPSAYREGLQNIKAHYLDSLGMYGPGCTVASEELWDVAYWRSDNELLQRNAIAALAERGETRGAEGTRKLVEIITGGAGPATLEAAVGALTPEPADVLSCAEMLSKLYFQDRANSERESSGLRSPLRRAIVEWFLRVGETQPDGVPLFVARSLGQPGIEDAYELTLFREMDAGRTPSPELALPFFHAHQRVLEERYPVLTLFPHAPDGSPASFTDHAKELLLKEFEAGHVRLPAERHAGEAVQGAARETILQALRSGNYPEALCVSAAREVQENRSMVARVTAAVYLGGAVSQRHIADAAFTPVLSTEENAEAPLLAVALAFYARHGFPTSAAAEESLRPLLTTAAKPLDLLGKNAPLKRVVAQAVAEPGLLFDQLDTAVKLELFTTWLNNEAGHRLMLGDLTTPAQALLAMSPATIGTVLEGYATQQRHAVWSDIMEYFDGHCRAVAERAAELAPGETLAVCLGYLNERPIRFGEPYTRLAAYFLTQLGEAAAPAAEAVGRLIQEYSDTFHGQAEIVEVLFAPLLRSMGEPGKAIIRSWIGAESYQLHQLGTALLCEEVAADSPVRQQALARLTATVASGSAERAGDVLFQLSSSRCLEGDPAFLPLVFTCLQRREERPRTQALFALSHASEDAIVSAVPALLYSLRDSDAGNRLLARSILCRRLPAEKVGLLNAPPQIGACSPEEIAQGSPILPPVSRLQAGIARLRRVWPKAMPAVEWHHGYEGFNRSWDRHSFEAGYQIEIGEIRASILRRPPKESTGE